LDIENRAKPLVASLSVLLLLVVATLFAWNSLRQSEISQVARIIQSEARSDRQELSRNLEIMIQALQDVKQFWERFGSMPPQQWRNDANIELSHFKGLDALLWYANEGETRYLRAGSQAGLNYRPSDSELMTYQALLEQLSTLQEDTVIGPVVQGEANLLQVYLLSKNPQAIGGLVAVIDLSAAITQIYRDVSPAYSVRVLQDGKLLFDIQQPAALPDPRWRAEGQVVTSLGTAWTVVHVPTQKTVESLTSPATNLLLALGLIISLLVAFLIYEYAGALGRVRLAETSSRTLSIANEDLERRVLERTREVRQRNADLQTITDSVAHDMRNPLNAISMTGQLLAMRLRKAGQDEEVALLERIKPSLGQMEEILDRLVGLSALSHATFERTPLDLAAEVQEIFDGLVVGEPPPEVTLTLEELPPASGDPILVRVLLMNLLSNALKYSRTSDPRHIRVGTTERDGQTVYFVKDNGIGFDAPSAARIFEAFERLGDEDETEGLGLGLMICKRVIQRHGGKLWARGEENKGATFYFTLTSPQSQAE
jgi:signal transduction histidine kinase